MAPETISMAAKNLDVCRRNQSSREQLTGELKDLSIADAYKIQMEGLRLRQNSGETVSGMKMGLTSEAKRTQMGLDSPCYGHLTKEMEIKNGGTLSLSESIHPKVEAEVAFYFSKPIHRGMSRKDLLSNCDGVAAALEILDTRYTAFKYFSIEDVVADNSSSYKYVLGDYVPIENIDILNLELKMKVNDEVVATGISNSISGDPVKSVEHLLELTHSNAHTFDVPGFILAGAATPAIDLKPSTKVSLEIDSLPTISFQVTE